MTPSAARTVLTAAALLAGAACSHTPPTSSPAPPPTARAGLHEAWRWTAPHPSYVGMPGADDGAVAVTYGHTWLQLLDAAGRPRWKAERLGLRDVAPRLTPDLVLAGTEEGVAAFDRVDGRRRWDATVGDWANTPVVVGRRAVASMWNGALAAFDLADGAVAWRTPLPGLAMGPAAAAGDTVVVSWQEEHGRAAGVTAVDVATGRPRWETRVPVGGLSGPAVVGPPSGPPIRSGPEAGTPLVVVVAGDVAAHALALDTGAEVWRTDLEGAGEPEVPPLALGGADVLVGHRLGGLALLDRRDGHVRWAVSSDGAAERGGPAGPGPGGRFALPLDDGRVLVAGPGRPTEILDPPGRVSGVAAGPAGQLLIATRETQDNALTADTGW